MALEIGDIDPKSVEAIFVGSESHPYAVKPTSGMLVSALQLNSFCHAADLEFACKAGTAAIQIAIGNVKSQIFSNIYLNEFDRYVKHTLLIKKYLRYGDDFAIFTDGRDEAVQYRKLMKTFLRSSPQAYRWSRRSGADRSDSQAPAVSLDPMDPQCCPQPQRHSDGRETCSRTPRRFRRAGLCREEEGRRVQDGSGE